MSSNTPRLDLVERNLIINGNMDFWQRGTSFAAAGNGQYSADRFKYVKVGTMVHTLSQSTDVPTQAQSGFQSLYSYLATVTTAEASMGASDQCEIRHVLEGQDYQQIHGKKCRLQFWVKVTGTGVTGTYSLSLFNSATNRFYVTTYSIPTAGTWTKIALDIPLDTTGTWNFDNTSGLIIVWALAMGSSLQTSTLNSWQGPTPVLGATSAINALGTVGNTFQLAQVMLIPQDFTQAGSSTVDVPFQRAGRSIGHELQMCQRYYEKSYVVDVAPGSATTNVLGLGIIQGATVIDNTQINFRTPKRATPTMTYYNNSGTATTTLTVQFGSTNSTQPMSGTNFTNTNCVSIFSTSGSGLTPTGGIALVQGNWTSDAEL